MTDLKEYDKDHIPADVIGEVSEERLQIVPFNPMACEAQKTAPQAAFFFFSTIPSFLQIDPFMSDPDFTFDAVDKASKACSGICLWVRAMHTYYYVAKNVEPKKAALAAAQASLDATMSQLAAVKARLAEVESKIASLEASFAAASAKKEQLAADVALCAARLERAQKLTGECNIL